MSVTIANCPRCDEESRLRAREFSDQATAALIAWGEMTKATVGNPVCDECYTDLRETLIDRADELTQLQDSKKTTQKPKKRATKKAS